MSDPIIFESASPRFGIPFLFMGQAQKEIFVNEAHALVDALLHCTIAGESANPPASPADGDTWLVGVSATGDWAGHDGELACRQSGNWLFVIPRDGLRVYDQAREQELLFLGEWQIPTAPAEPTGGTTVDAEARAAIAGVMAALRQAGILPGS